jgi:hypothetical protein
MTDNITLPRATVQQALVALEYASTGNRRPEIIGPAITALRTALEQQQAEPCQYCGLSECDPKCMWVEQPQQQQAEPVAYDKTEINCFVQSLYDKKMQEGKHGHYETMFHVVHQAIKKVAPPKQQADPVQERITHITWDERGVRTVNGIPDDAPRRKPLTDEQIGQDPIFRAGVRFAEAAHNIK